MLSLSLLLAILIGAVVSQPPDIVVCRGDCTCPCATDAETTDVETIGCGPQKSCTLNCNGNDQCTSGDSNDRSKLVCGPGDCIINCNGKNSCGNTKLDGSEARDVTILCRGQDSCSNALLICGSGDCKIDCNGQSACNNTKLDGVTAMDLEVTCKGCGACANAEIDCGSCDCSLDCNGRNSCDDVAVDTTNADNFECIGFCQSVPTQFTSTDVSCNRGRDQVRTNQEEQDTVDHDASMSKDADSDINLVGLIVGFIGMVLLFGIGFALCAYKGNWVRCRNKVKESKFSEVAMENDEIEMDGVGGGVKTDTVELKTEDVETGQLKTVDLDK